MFLFLSKLLPLLVYPLSLASLLIALALLLRRRRWAPALLVVAFMALWLGGNRWVSFGLVRSLEWQYFPPADPAPVDAIVLLGGGTRGGAWPRPLHEMNEAGDRVLYAAALYRAGKAPLLVATGGNLPWRGPQAPEAHSMASLLAFMGVPETAILMETASRNTYENAVFTRDLLAPAGARRILLVTSAMHMPRSVPLFEQQGFEVIPAPADYLISENDWRVLTWPDIRNQLEQLFPDAQNLYWTTLALKEYIGIAVYSLRGWM